MRENRAGSCVKMEAHSSERAEGGGEDNDLSSLLDTTLRGLIHRRLCTLDVSFVRATAAGGEGGVRSSPLRRWSEFKGRGANVLS